MAVFNDALWFDGFTPANGIQLFKLGNDGSVTQWTNFGTGLLPDDLTVFNDALWFNGFTATGQQQLFKLGDDGSVTQWTANPGVLASGLRPGSMTVFSGALWFQGETATGTQLFKLGSDDSVTQWTATGSDLFPAPLSSGSAITGKPQSVLDNALWFAGTTAATGTELYKLGADGSFTFWKDINPGPPSSSPHDWARFG